MSEALINNFRARVLARQPLRIRGHGSKDFYGGPLEGQILDTTVYRGILNYEPSELVITARCGTPLAEIQATLAERGQCLPFDPPRFDAKGTIGGAIASGLSGPARLSVGAARDFMLGVTLMDGEGRVLKFGGEVMKNVAGFDVSRLMAGSLGTLGLLLDLSIKVLPVPVCDRTLSLAVDEVTALTLMNQWAGRPLPISATAWHEGQLYVRLAGAKAAVESAQADIAKVSRGDTALETIWAELRDHRHSFFAGDTPLWRLALPTTAPVTNLGAALIEWGGGLRWLRGTHDPASIRATAASLGGHATQFRGGDKSVGVFQPLAPAVLRLHQQLKARFDPHGVFNPGRLSPEF